MQSLTLCPSLSSDSFDNELLFMSTSKKTQESVSVRPRSRSRSAVSWTPPPCQVAVTPRHPLQFWKHVTMKAAEVGDWNLLEKIGPPTRMEMAAAAASGGPVAFPVFKTAPNLGQQGSHQVFAWRVVQDLQSKVDQYGVNSLQVMQVIRVLNADVLVPYDIVHLATILFHPVQYGVFQATWKHMVERIALDNMQLPQHDPRHAVGVYALLGNGPFSNPDLQARWDPLILAQAQQLGMSALLKTMEMAAPKPRYITIQQGVKEPFLQFVERVAAALEKQVEDDKLKQILCRQLARDNVNDDCRRIIDSLLGDPSLSDLVVACSKVGSG
ncbi:uncharacterized protein LOC118701558 [Molothrus ater]|uniref:uncharacterized protein LOC118701558 n=1 Tax=Molothrus ater TaxID=84834 RepID=UPI00174E9B64|nr:uncharacterized protein LOC118701558 [Molothrus ater]